MSRFFANSYEYDSASSSSEEDLLSSSEEELLVSSSSGEEDSDDSFFDESAFESDVDSDDSDAKPYGPDWFKKQEFRKGGNRKFLKGADYSGSDESDEESKKVVKSAKEKLLDEMQTSCSKIDAAELTRDWITILNEFDNVTRLLIRAQQQNFGTPNVFVKVLGQVEDAVAGTSQDDLKIKAVAKAYNTVKQRVRKTARENEELLVKFREDPESFDNEPIVEIDTTPESTPFGNKKSINLSSLAMASSEAGFFPALRIVLDSRGKKNVDQQALVKSMEQLLETANTPYEKIFAYLTLIPIRFDSSVNLSYQPIEQWKASYNDIINLFSILDESLNTFHVTELASINEFIEQEPEANEHGIKKILGSVFSFVERLDDEFNKSLLNTDPHSSDYLVRLKDEQYVYNLIIRVQLYMEATLPEEQKETSLARVFVRRLDHIYYKSSNLIQVMESKAWKTIPSNYTSKFIPFDASCSKSYLSNMIQALTESLSKQENAAMRKRATLYHVYYTALNKEFQIAKDMLIESKVQSFINKSDPSLQILFNRVVVQLGLSAFKLCLIDECHQILNDLLASSHLREILGQQSLQRMSNSPNADDREKLCLPFHEHINLDLIDVVFMTCSLLIEIPQMTAFYSGIKIKKIPYSQKSIRRALEHYDKSSFQGPPETLRDYVLHAAKSMQKGDWKTSFEFLKSIKTWALLPNASTVLETLSERVQIESLKTYFFTNKRFYSKLSVKKLAELFDLTDEKVVHSLQSVITEYEINATISKDKLLVNVEKGDEITKLEEIASKLNKEVKIAKERLHPTRGRR